MTIPATATAHQMSATPPADAGTHTECADDACGLAHASKAELLDAMDEIASRDYDEGKDAARGER